MCRVERHYLTDPVGADDTDSPRKHRVWPKRAWLSGHDTDWVLDLELGSASGPETHTGGFRTLIGVALAAEGVEEFYVWSADRGDFEKMDREGFVELGPP
jgi:hypothetical protein